MFGVQYCQVLSSQQKYIKKQNNIFYHFIMTLQKIMKSFMLSRRSSHIETLIKDPALDKVFQHIKSILMLVSIKKVLRSMNHEKKNSRQFQRIDHMTYLTRWESLILGVNECGKSLEFLLLDYLCLSISFSNFLSTQNRK